MKTERNYIVTYVEENTFIWQCRFTWVTDVDVDDEMNKLTPWIENSSSLFKFKRCYP